MTARWPRAWQQPPVRATWRRHPADFQVRETLGFEPSGSGEHLLVHVEKSGRTTSEVAAALARAHGIAGVDVGYAGMKDKQAVARQWFSLRGVACCADIAGPGLELLDTARHHRKLRRGELRANCFEIRLEAVGREAAERGLAYLAAEGAPNYFGEQRFGWDNLEKARCWLSNRRKRRVSRFKAGLYLSVLRGYLFNEVLAARVRHHSWRTNLPGDVLLNGHPTAPLWGRGRSGSAAVAAAIEAQALTDHAVLCDGLEHAGLNQDRRPLALDAQALSWRWEEDAVLVRFSLPPGGYASSLLGEVFELDRPPVSSGSMDAQA